MTTVLTVTSKGQITLSQMLLQALRLKTGDKISVRLSGGTAVLEPIGQGILSVAGSLGRLKVPKGKDVDDMIKEAREEHIL